MSIHGNEFMETLRAPDIFTVQYPSAFELTWVHSTSFMQTAITGFNLYFHANKSFCVTFLSRQIKKKNLINLMN